MELNYASYRNREGTFYRPSFDVIFQYQSRSLLYKTALVDSGSDYVMLPMSIAEVLGAEPDLESETIMQCACGNSFKSYSSRYAIEIAIAQKGFRPKKWQTFVQFVDAEVSVLLGQRGFLDHFDVTLHGKRHVMNIMEST